MELRRMRMRRMRKMRRKAEGEDESIAARANEEIGTRCICSTPSKLNQKIHDGLFPTDWCS